MRVSTTREGEGWYMYYRGRDEGLALRGRERVGTCIIGGEMRVSTMGERVGTCIIGGEMRVSTTREGEGWYMYYRGRGKG